MSRIWKRIQVCLMTAALIAGLLPFGGLTARADLWDASENFVVKQSSISRGKIGRSMNLTVEIYNDSDSEWEDVYVTTANHFDYGGYRPGPENSGDDDVFPFEMVAGKSIAGGISPGKHKSVSIPGKVRADLTEGYYRVEVLVYTNWNSKEGIGSEVASEFVSIYVSMPGAGDTEDPGDVNKQIAFVLGENQPTPYGVYPNIMEFSINMRNSGLAEARDVTVEMVLDKDSSVFPFDINDGTYDRYHEVIAAGETVQLPYSMAIREDTYSGFYPIGFKINYRESATGDLQTQEDIFWVRIKNKEREEENPGAFDEHSSAMARIVVDSFNTVPEDIIAGEPFQLILRMKNASSDIPASNIMLTLDAEASGGGAAGGGSGGGKVFTTQSGSSSYVINSLAPGEVTEITLDMLSLAGIDQRTYYLNINETYDSPEYKNAEATVSINIPVKQVARLNTGTIDVMPAEIEAGGESNIMFPINNTGKVILYNVMVSFEADSIEMPNETYVGNINPGQTGNVDAMVTGVAASQDDGKVKILITYEDEYGEVQDPVEKELTLLVTEVMEPEPDIPIGGEMEMQEETGGEPPYLLYLAAAAVIVGALIGVTLFVKRRKKKARQKELENIEDSNDEIW